MNFEIKSQSVSSVVIKVFYISLMVLDLFVGILLVYWALTGIPGDNAGWLRSPAKVLHLIIFLCHGSWVLYLAWRLFKDRIPDCWMFAWKAHFISAGLCLLSTASLWIVVMFDNWFRTRDGMGPGMMVVYGSFAFFVLLVVWLVSALIMMRLQKREIFAEPDDLPNG